MTHLVLRWVAIVRTRLRLLFARGAAESRMDAEIRFHIDMETERLMHVDGVTQGEARRLAIAAFGGVEKHKEALRDGRGLAWLGGMSLDAKLGARMLLKYPSLTLIGGFAIAVAVAIGATFFEIINEALHPAIPVEQGERVVSLQYATSIAGDPERRVLPEFIAWRNELTQVQELGAFRVVYHNLASADGYPEPVRVAEITASGFTVARTPPLVGRYLLPADEREDARAVVVISHRAWQTRFAADPAIVGRTVKLGAVRHAIVGVMPEGFEFPVHDQFWIPLRINASTYLQPLQGPPAFVFGRLAPGATLATAQAELTTIGQRTAAAYPTTHARLRLMVLPYTRGHVEIDRPEIVWGLRVVQLLIGALLVVVAVNLAVLVYARTVTRLGEIAVRSALGASRRRILTQLFMEAFALAGAGAAGGLALARINLLWVQSVVSSVETVPFWITFDLSPGTMVYAFALAVLAAVIVGVVPGLQATRRQLYTNLHTLTGGTGMRLGVTWTALIVVQVAIAVTMLPVAIYAVSEVVRMEVSAPGFPADRFVVAKLDMKEQSRQREVMRRLAAEPAVSAVAFSSSIPGFAPGYRIAFDRGTPLPNADSEVDTLKVDIEIFKLYGADTLAGRVFTASDVGAAANVVVVNRAFARQLLGSESVLGQRFSFLRPGADAGGRTESYEIVGIVSDFPAFPPTPDGDGQPTVYHPAAPGQLSPIVLSLRFKGPVPNDAIGRIRQIGADVDPSLPLRDVTLLTDFYRRNRSIWRVMSWGLGLVTMSVLLLSAAGIYSLLSFTVAQRTREIGIRTALGAHPRRLLISIFGRVLRQLMIGLAVGAVLSAALLSTTTLNAEGAAVLLLAVGAIILVVGVVAAIGPARRSLRIETSEALRADA